MERISRSALEILFGSMIAEKDISIFGYDNKLHFEIYDGFAYCPDYNGSEFSLIYPKIEFANKSKEMKKSIRDFLNMSEDEQISIYDLMQVFNEMAKDNERIQYDKDKNEYVPKEMWKVMSTTH